MTDDQETDVLRDVAEASTRFLAGAVPRRTMQDLQRLARDGDTYPWQAVVDRVLEEPIGEQELVQQSLRAQRDWVMRGGRETPKKKLKTKAKGLLAWVIVKVGFFLIYTGAVVVLLNLVRHIRPDLNIYVLLDLARQYFPSAFGR